MAKFFKAIFTSPPSDPAAQAEVLAAVRACNIRHILDALDITHAECTAALKHSASHRSPGLDGIPTE